MTDPDPTVDDPEFEAMVRELDAWLAGRLKVTAADVRRELQGRHLYCFCKQGEPCHADVLIEVANR